MDDIDNIIALLPPARGARPQPVSCTVVREISTNDIADLLEPTTLGSSTPAVKRLRTQHHNLAKLLANKMTAVEASGLTGYSPSRISLLQKDPAFQELVAYYQEQANMQYLDVHAKLANLGEAVVEELQERLENDPEGLPVGTLLKIGEFALDRSSAPPKTKATMVGQGLPKISISFHKGAEPEQLTIESEAPAEPKGEEEAWLKGE